MPAFHRSLSRASGVALAASLLLTGTAAAQRGDGPPTPMREAQQLDRDGKHAEARAIFQRLIDEAPNAESRAQAQRRMAMSYGFENDCANAVKYEELVIGYWVTREQAEPQDAFYQQGEMANEAARVCLEAGELDEAERMYRRGYELGLKEPEPRTHPKSLWDYRLAHALGRIAARRGDRGEAQRQVAEARRILDSDPEMAENQERFYPYLAGYVALYTGDLKAAEEILTGAVAMEGNQRDAFVHCLLAMAYEKQGRTADAKAMYRKAYDLATSHNPPSAFTKPYAREKLAQLK